MKNKIQKNRDKNAQKEKFRPENPKRQKVRETSSPHC